MRTEMMAMSLYVYFSCSGCINNCGFFFPFVCCAKCFADVKWTTVSPKYLPKKAGMEEKSSWVRLFERMGIRRHLVVEKTFVELKKVSSECITLGSDLTTQVNYLFSIGNK